MRDNPVRLVLPKLELYEQKKRFEQLNEKANSETNSVEGTSEKEPKLPVV